MTSACDRVFSTPELLEAILIQLTPVNHLLQAQRISRVFHTTITSSPTIQQLLFFRPSTTKNPKEWTINPLLRQHFKPWFFIPESRWSRPEYGTLHRMEWTPTPERRDAFLRPEASWRKMLFVQPPPKELKVAQRTNTMDGDSHEEAYISLPEGVTMAPLYDLAESHVRDEHVSSFAVSVKNAEDGGAPQITLQLMSTMQCCSYRKKKKTFRSLGAETKYEPWSLEWKSSKDRKWRTDLTAEKGGIAMEEWNAWRERKVPVVEGEEDSEPEPEDW